MSTAETITAVIALAAARGGGAVLKSWLDHSRYRRDREATINQRSVEIAEALMTTQEAALARARSKSEALRAELGTGPNGIDGETVRRGLADLAQFLGEVDALQRLQHRQIRGWLDRTTGPVHPHP